MSSSEKKVADIQETFDDDIDLPSEFGHISVDYSKQQKEILKFAMKITSFNLIINKYNDNKKQHIEALAEKYVTNMSNNISKTLAAPILIDEIVSTSELCAQEELFSDDDIAFSLAVARIMTFAEKAASVTATMVGFK